ncbi:hypothetical protein Y695_00059 [Hydrogenophaga sp. T4]|nr:hypothetical protein Y695_00059 [Hydrogenophaga sp. T4]
MFVLHVFRGKLIVEGNCWSEIRLTYSDWCNPKVANFGQR